MTECEHCNFLISYIKELILQQKPKNYIMNEFETSYILLPDKWIDFCNGDLIIKLIRNSEHPSKICNMLGLCKKVNKYEFNNLIVNNNNNNNDLEAENSGCTFCKHLTKKVEYYLQQTNSTEKEIISYLDEECELLDSKDLVLTCQILVLQNTPIVIDLINNSESPSLICQNIDICPTLPSLYLPVQEK
ncbi:hypothetical protein DDB_G0274967 [Dictyostelium discoideum AX4]|uniref:Saposin B-type domain-containing protein n=1 Tax=Dictyostelium discoideum TaxID=44689 RepID=Q86KA8_DICDI|nr:hypothetical protein DDB_G0274967 [Dictyostelium discoideum AX4]EAL70376.1 hypothetical protein DDB_G0274967 [Dictyostelium discoideum AX4]|eukprot:XP_644231.1 hypothetical protein DDB_G0274967 [Dictyostelium discoideum AX4]